MKAKTCPPITLPVDRFCIGHPLCAGSTTVTTDDPVLAACVREIDRDLCELAWISKGHVPYLGTQAVACPW